MANARIGALRVDLGMNTAAFEKGVTLADRKLNQFAGRMRKLSGKLTDIGKMLSVGVTAPIVAAGAAFAKVGNDMARDSREIKKSAQVAGEGFEDFQRQAHAAKTVGIEFEKLGDIFKDVRDRVGDFAATGGGPMADFFENIAPKVGVTAKAFEGLGGKDALQLYYNSLKQANVSQEEMVFYLEAMASDATNLIPLLENNGKAMDDLGRKAAVISDSDAESLERYVQAQEEMSGAFRELTIALVDSGLLDAITSIIKKVAEFTRNLAETNPMILKVSVAALGLAAALGPIFVGAGAVAGAISSLSAAFASAGVAGSAASLGFKGVLAAFAPLLIKAAAVAAVAYVIIDNWDEIEPELRPVIQAVEELTQGFMGLESEASKTGHGAKIKSEWQIAGEGLREFLTIMGDVAHFILFDLRHAFNGFQKFLKFDLLQASQQAGAALGRQWYGVKVTFAETSAAMVIYMRDMVQGVRRWVVDGLNRVWDETKAKIQQVKRSFFDLYDAVVGNSYIPDMVDEIGQHMARLDMLMVDKAAQATQKTADKFRQLAYDVRTILAELFPEQEAINQRNTKLATIDEGEAKGLIDAATAEEARVRARRVARTGSVEPGAAPFEGAEPKELPRLNDTLKDLEKSMEGMGDKAEIQTVRVAESFRDMAQRTSEALRNMVDAIKGGGFFDILDGVIGLVTQLGGMGLFGSKFAGQINGPVSSGGLFGGGGFKLPGFATGGSFQFGGMPGIDRNILSLNGNPIARVSKGEIANIQPANSNDRGVTNNYYTLPSDEFWGRVDAAAAGQINDAAPRIAAAGAQAGVARIMRMQDRAL